MALGVLQSAVVSKVGADEFLDLRVKLDPALPLSSTGKTRLPASTGGYVDTGCEFRGKDMRAMVVVTVKA